MTFINFSIESFAKIRNSSRVLQQPITIRAVDLTLRVADLQQSNLEGAEALTLRRTQCKHA